MSRVLVAGSINMDIVVTASRNPRPGETIIGEALEYLPGGKGANLAIAAARLGRESLLIARTGDDEFGSVLRASLAAAGVSLEHVIATPDASSGVAVVVVAGAENSIIVISGANALLGPADVSAVRIAPGDVLVSQFEIAPETIESFFLAGRAQLAATVLNPSPFGSIAPSLMDLTDVLLVNEVELRMLASDCGMNADDEPRALITALRQDVLRPGQAIVVTLGPEGCLLAVGGREVALPGRRVAVRDTTGAGDCFAGALAHQLAGGASLEEAARIANVAASLCVQRVGASSSMPDASELASALERAG